VCRRAFPDAPDDHLTGLVVHHKLAAHCPVVQALASAAAQKYALPHRHHRQCVLFSSFGQWLPCSIRPTARYKRADMPINDSTPSHAGKKISGLWYKTFQFLSKSKFQPD